MRRPVVQPRIGDKRGFTLIELLVVIAIITILAAMLFPVFVAAQDKARVSTCLTNTRQLGMAFGNYLGDYGKYPGGAPAGRFTSNTATADWIWYVKDATVPTMWGYRPDATKGRLAKYVKNKGVFLCPNDIYYRKTSANVSYSMNAFLDWQYSIINHSFSGKPTGVKESNIARPTKCVLLIDEGRGCRGINGSSLSYPYVGMYDGWFYDGIDAPYSCHTHGTTFLFCDGHSALVTDAGFRTLIYEPTAVQPPVRTW